MRHNNMLPYLFISQIQRYKKKSACKTFSMIFKEEHTGNTPSGSKKFETPSVVWSMDPLDN